MFQRPGCHLGDTWYAVRGETAHLFYLTCPDSVERHTRWSIGHAVSRDLREWEIRPDLFHANPADPARSCLSTGSVCRYGGRWVMAFLGNHNTPDPVTVCAVSEDLETWTPVPEAETRMDGQVYTRRGSRPFKNPRWRDPFLFEEDGWLYQLITAAVAEAPEDADGVVGVMRTRDLVHWEVRPPLHMPRIGTDLECPKLYKVDGKYHLLVSMFHMLQAPDFAARQPRGLNANTTYSLVADRLEGPYSFAGDGRVLTEDTPGMPYACEAVFFQGEWYLLGTCWSERRPDCICDPVRLNVTPIGFRTA